MQNIFTVDDFTRAYVECALWSEAESLQYPDTGKGFGEVAPDMEDLAPETIGQMIADCAKFQLENSAALKTAYGYKHNMDASKANSLPDYTPSQAGHDFWLTRNGHGAGFWDRGIGATGETLSNASRVFGTCDLYIGDDGKIYDDGQARNMKNA